MSPLLHQIGWAIYMNLYYASTSKDGPMKYILSILMVLAFVSCTNPLPARVGERIFVTIWRKSPFDFLDMYPPDTYTYIVGTDGKGEINLTLSFDVGDQPQWTPDGEWIVTSTKYRQPSGPNIFLVQ